MVETGFVLDEVRQRVLGPDVAFRDARRRVLTQPPQPGFFRGAPDLAVEVRSPSQSHPEMATKAEWVSRCRHAPRLGC